ncbi:hypothetical protein EB796_018852 [Bugula neritina]|uniref:Uncharacterized protein n=1 Tax=Bugula neritina TaxID=10212 RepID=A0A7J7JBS6_BUGNE|nr:hypothetical protein EB796_018852 [Bugula neritina]
MFYTIVTDEEPFQYSYVRQFTQSIPEGYEFYLELSLSDSGYADITSLSPGGTEYKYGTSNTNTGAYVLTDDLEVVDYTDVRSSGRIFSEVSIECDSNNTQKQKNSLDSSGSCPTAMYM